MAAYDVVEVSTLDGRRVRLRFVDGLERTIDLTPHLEIPIMRRVRDDAAYFATVRVDAAAGTIVWPNGEDLAPDVLHGDGVPARLTSR